MASVMVSVPPELYVEIPPTVLYAELCNQRDQATPGTPASDFKAEDPTWPTEKATATMRARVLSAYFGVVPLDMQHTVVGVGQNPEAMKLAQQLFKKVRETIQTERYGRGSFIQEFVKGKVSTLDFQTLVTNWTLDARICEIEVAGETAAAAAIRNANRMVYMTALTEIRQLWRATYEKAFQSASANVGITGGLKKKRYERARDLYRDMMDNPPAPPPNIGRLSSRECEQAKEVPFAFRAKQDRLAVFRGFMKKDIVASHFSTVMSVVDVRRLAVNAVVPEGEPRIPPFWTMISNHWAHACDLINSMIISYQVDARSEQLLMDPGLRTSGYTWSDRSLECYDQIRGLFDCLGFFNEQYGSWKETPILRAENRGIKRARNHASTGRGANMVVDQGAGAGAED